MKKRLVYFFSTLILNCIYSQDLESAIRYSSDETQGTARFKAMAGAFGALGADMSGVSINPAGAAVFNTSHGVLSGSLKSQKTDVSYRNGAAKNSSSHIDLHQLGAAFVFKNYKRNTPWKKFVLSVFYERLEDFNANFSIQANTSNSIASYFLENADGLKLGDIRLLNGETISQAYADIGAIYGYQHQQGFLGFEGGILEPLDIDDDENTQYTSNIGAGNFIQEFDYLTLGNSGKLSANIAFQYNENIHLGLNLNSHFIDFEKSTFLIEENSNPDSSVNLVNFENKLYTTGGGFSLQLGTLIKLTDELRLGFNYDSPTWLTLREETTQFLSTLNELDNLSYIVNPSVVNIFPDYNLKTPGKITASMAYVLGTSGLISFDYGRKNYTQTSFDTQNRALNIALNNAIYDSFTIANSYRIGGELRHKNISFRGGYKLLESPYKDKNLYGDLKGFSLGLGYNFGNSRIDLSYENSKRAISQNLYNTGALGSTYIERNISDFTISLSMNL